MSQVLLEMSMSLDGYVAAPDVSDEEPMGRGLHEWMFAGRSPEAAVHAGLVDEGRLHLVPVALGGGTRLFDGARSDLGLVPTAAVATPLVTHLTYEVDRSATGES